jgi:hypothetical protein
MKCYKFSLEFGEGFFLGAFIASVVFVILLFMYFRLENNVVNGKEISLKQGDFICKRVEN